MKRLMIFAHFDAANEIKPYVAFLLDRLRPFAARFVFVSTSPLPEPEVQKARQLVDEVLLKENVGLDFGMWKHALEGEGFDRGGLDEYDELVLVNSSVFGPIFPLGPIFDRMETSRCDFWGMTDNEEHAWHLQSYFLAFKRRLFASEPFRQFWRGVLPYHDKRQIIQSYEIGLTTFLRERGFVAHAVAPARKLPFSKWRKLRDPHLGGSNPMCHYPIELIRNGMPFVKAELLRENPLHVPLAPVYRAIARTGYDLDLIEFDRPPKRRLDLWPTHARRALRALRT